MVVAAEQRGKPFDAIRGGSLVIEGRTFFLKTAAGNEFKGEIRIDPTKSPKQLDFVHATGGVVWQAIYTVDEVPERVRVEHGAREGRQPSICHHERRLIDNCNRGSTRLIDRARSTSAARSSMKNVTRS